MRGTTLDVEHRVTVAHELTHVLQDQHFDLHEAAEAGATTRIPATRGALKALVEGDAVRIQEDYLAAAVRRRTRRSTSARTTPRARASARRPRRFPTSSTCWGARRTSSGRRRSGCCWSRAATRRSTMRSPARRRRPRCSSTRATSAPPVAGRRARAPRRRGRVGDAGGRSVRSRPTSRSRMRIDPGRALHAADVVAGGRGGHVSRASGSTCYRVVVAPDVRAQPRVPVERGPGLGARPAAHDRRRGRRPRRLHRVRSRAERAGARRRSGSTTTIDLLELPHRDHRRRGEVARCLGRRSPAASARVFARAARRGEAGARDRRTARRRPPQDAQLRAIGDAERGRVPRRLRRRLSLSPAVRVTVSPVRSATAEGGGGMVDDQDLAGLDPYDLMATRGGPARRVLRERDRRRLGEADAAARAGACATCSRTSPRARTTTRPASTARCRSSSPTSAPRARSISRRPTRSASTSSTTRRPSRSSTTWRDAQRAEP